MPGYLHEDFCSKAELYGLPRSRSSLLKVFFAEGSCAQILYRMMRYCQTHHLQILAAVIYRVNASTTHAVIGRKAEIGPGFVITHSLGVVINSSVRAGRNLVIEHGATIGEEKFKSPVIGDNVYIGPGAKVIGGIRIGSNVKIGANAVVVSDLPDGATAVGIPAKVVRIYGEKVLDAAAGFSENSSENKLN